jgi:hypothetical protein
VIYVVDCGLRKISGRSVTGEDVPLLNATPREVLDSILSSDLVLYEIDKIIDRQITAVKSIDLLTHIHF